MKRRTTPIKVHQQFVLTKSAHVYQRVNRGLMSERPASGGKERKEKEIEREREREREREVLFKNKEETECR
jgi:hypothetical protein